MRASDLGGLVRPGAAMAERAATETANSFGVGGFI